LARPDLRAQMERKLNLVAAGQANKDEVVRDILKEMGDIFADL